MLIAPGFNPGYHKMIIVQELRRMFNKWRIELIVSTRVRRNGTINRITKAGNTIKKFMLKKIFIACLAIAFTNFLFAQVKWPAITQQTKPWTRWWWQGSAVDKPNLTASMQLYQQAGLGGLEITPIYGVGGYENKFIDYLSPQWIQMLGHTLKEGKTIKPWY